MDDLLTTTDKKTLRLIRLLELLKLKPWTAKDLASQLGVQKRAVNYYLKNLKKLEPHLGFKITHDPIRHQYSLNQGVVLSDIDKVVTHMALRMLYHHSAGHSDQYQEALLKIGRGLPEPAQTITQESVRAMAQREPSLEGMNLEKITNAWFGRRVIQFYYQAPDRQQPRQYQLEVYFIEVSRANLAVYVIGLEQMHSNQLRTFKLNRMQHIALIGPSKAYEIPASFDPKTYLSNAWGVVGSSGGIPVRVRLRFRKDAAHRIKEGGYPSLETRELEDGSLEVELTAGTNNDNFPLELLSWVQSWGPRVEVLEPPNLRQRWLEEARQVVSKAEPPEVPHE